MDPTSIAPTEMSAASTSNPARRWLRIVTFKKIYQSCVMVSVARQTSAVIARKDVKRRLMHRHRIYSLETPHE